MRNKLTVMILFGLLLIAALPLMAQDSGPNLSGTTWEWVQTVTPKETIAAADPSRYQIMFAEDGSVAVTLDCNRGFGSYTLDGQSIQIALGGSTMAMCPPDSQADVFSQQLSNAAIFFFQDGHLFIDQAMDSGTMEFRPIAAALTGISWEWAGTTGGSEDVSVADPTRYKIDFAADGTLHFIADCNVGNGTYTSADDSLSITLGAMTMAMCPEDSQDGVFLQQLEGAASFALGSGTLDVILADGSVMHFRAAGTAAPTDASLIIGTTWEWVDLQMGNSSEAVTPPESYTITFNRDGSVNIQADCNVAFGQYIAAEGSGKIMVGGVTRVLCPEDSRSNQFLDLLGQVVAYNMTTDGWLELFTAEGFRLTFKPAPAGDVITTPVLIGTTWQWVQTETPAETIVAVDPARYTVTFNADGSYNMRADCNNGRGDFTDDNGVLTIGPGMITLMGCPEDTQDSVFLEHLNDSAAYFFQDGNLFISQTAGSTMKFRPAPAAEPVLTGVTWQWQQTVTPVETFIPADPAQYTILFNDDGSYALQADCNSGRGEFTVDGQSINLGPAATTMMACAEDSLGGTFLLQLSNAAIFFFQDGDLFIDQMMDGGTLQFSAAQ